MYRVSKLVTDDNILMGIGPFLHISTHRVRQIRDDNQRNIKMAAIEMLEKSRQETENDHLFIEQLSEAFTEMGLERNFKEIEKPSLEEP